MDVSVQDIYDYIYVSQGKTKVDSIDDNEELQYTEEAFNILGFRWQYWAGPNSSQVNPNAFSEQEKYDCKSIFITEKTSAPWI